jgi:hypothetical protein
MRTLASTFSTRDEAEAASRRLQSIGIPHQRIVLKDVAPTGEGPGGPGSKGGVFISVKVTTEQVPPVSEILKGQAKDEDDVPAFQDLGEEPVLKDRPVSERMTVPVHDQPPPRSLAPETPASPKPVAAGPRQDRTRLGRYLIFYGLALVAAFMIGAWAGLLS